MREGLEYLELTHAPAGTHVCDCGAVWKLIVLGVQLNRAGAKSFWCKGVLWRGGAEGRKRCWVGGCVMYFLIT